VGERRPIKLRADSGLLGLSIIILITAMLIEGLLFLPIIDSSLKAQVQTFTVYMLTTSIVVLAIVEVAAVLKRKF
jgi:hypothetical protein